MNVDKLDVHTYLATAASSSPPSLLPFFEKFRAQHDRRWVPRLCILQRSDALLHLCRLWHQLTLTLEEFYRHPDSPPYHFDVFNNFVHDFEARLNQLKLVELGVRAGQQLDSELSEIYYGYAVRSANSYFQALPTLSLSWSRCLNEYLATKHPKPTFYFSPNSRMQK